MTLVFFLQQCMLWRRGPLEFISSSEKAKRSTLSVYRSSPNTIYSLSPQLKQVRAVAISWRLRSLSRITLAKLSNPLITTGGFLHARHPTLNQPWVTFCFCEEPNKSRINAPFGVHAYYLCSGSTRSLVYKV